MSSRYFYFFFIFSILSILAWGFWTRSQLFEERALHQQTRTERDLLLLDQAVSNATIKGLSAQVTANSKLLFEERRRAARRQEIMQEAKTMPNPQEVVDYATSKKVLEHLNSGIKPVSSGVMRP